MNTTKKQGLFALALGSVGVVYGDIGTSPLYAFRESLAASGGGPAAVIGIVSLILWTLTIIVTLKYVLLLLRADNRGEGGILSLMALAARSLGKRSHGLLFLGIAGAALFYGDALITPAISVLSAVEGLKLITPAFTPYVMPISIVIILLLFVVQRFGTEKVSWVIGPVMVVWFAAMAWGGMMHIEDSPLVWQALNPLRGVEFLLNNGFAGIIALGAVFLAVTGAEALYADLGHFGRRPIQWAWFVLVFPALGLNYLGQGALVLATPEAASNPFYLLYPEWALPWMVGLATLATVIAAQAVITGAFSLTHQAVQLGLLPRQHVLFTSEGNKGQIYLPQVNWALMVGVLLLIAMFHTSSNLAHAYGIAVTGTMVITTLLFAIIVRKMWRLPWVVAGLVILPLLALEAVFFAANMAKFFHGGFMPILLSAGLILMMLTWRRGTESLMEQARAHNHALPELFTDLNRDPPRRVDGVAVYLTSNPTHAPSALLYNLKHNKVLHAQNVLLNLVFENAPTVAEEERLSVETLNRDFMRVTMRYGFMDAPNVTRALCRLREKGVAFDLMHTTFFVARRSIVPSATFGMPVWRDKIFIAMANNASDAAGYFHLPRGRVVELGVQMTV